MSESAWVPINDYPGDQRFDHIKGNDRASYWGEIGTTSDGGWSWTIIGTNDAADQWDEASGRASTQAEAKAVVEAWRPSDGT